MIQACKFPWAQNFDPTAVIDDFSCDYVFKSGDNCHWFEDVIPSVPDGSFTMSYSVRGQSWVFFHDYAPDMYFHTRRDLYTAKNNSVYKHNEGPAGQYYSNVPKPFFIDVLFRADGDLILETVNWITEFLQNDTDQPFQTLSHIAIWNAHQHTGRISTAKLQKDSSQTVRKTKGLWRFDDFRNILVSKGQKFLLDLFNDYALNTAVADPAQAWYRKELLMHNWFCVRFEFDNSADATVLLHETTIQAIKSNR